MPITLAKTYELLYLNLLHGERKMPPDVADAIRKALDALKLVQHLIQIGLVTDNLELKGAPLEPPEHSPDEQTHTSPH